MMDDKEAKGMEGLEFTYIYDDGDTIPAYVKKYDKDIGLSCYTLEPTTSFGWSPHKDKDKLPDGTYCIIAYDFIKQPERKENALKTLKVIRAIGEYKEGSIGSSASCGLGSFIGCQF